METLTTTELTNLVMSVFPPLSEHRVLAIMVDLPNTKTEDNENWAKRRQIALDWTRKLEKQLSLLNLDKINLVAYKNVGSNNADLPENMYLLKDTLPPAFDSIEEETHLISRQSVFTQCHLFLVLTEYSATAPMKIAATKYGFRAATMPGFSVNMIPALKLDYNEINKKTLILKEKLDLARLAKITFLVDDQHEYSMEFDLRFRNAHASGGRFPLKGTAGNLPSGETYIVPYEGEMDEKSETNGLLPVQFDDEIVIYSIHQNQATDIVSKGPLGEKEKNAIKNEPAYANMAELGFGVLADFGLKPIGEVLLDEKLGFHIAFGRSDHFGGIVGPAQFSAPEHVIHIDRIYIPETQPRIKIKSIYLYMQNNTPFLLIQNGAYQCFHDTI